MTPCEQHDKIKHIEADLANHREWRKSVSTQLTNIEIQLATFNQRQKDEIESFKAYKTEGDKQGGYRDRIVILEQAVKEHGKNTILSGIIGGLIGAGAPNAVKFLSGLLGG